MKTTPMAKLAPLAALALLAACGQGASTDEAEATAEEAAAPQTAEDVEWLPDAIVLPEGHVLLNNAKLSIRTDLLQVTVVDDPSAQVPAWKSALEEAGYTVNESEANSGLLFSGNGVESGQIAISRPEDGEGYMIQIDMTQEAQ